MTAWDAAAEALERALQADRAVRIWLRDDDCVAVTPALERLTAICDAVALPILLAVIPEPAEDTLAPWIAAHVSVRPCQHGFAHANHAGPGERARELGARPADTVLSELGLGRAKLKALFGARLSDILVPPWNRIDEALVPRLQDLGFSALSTFGPTPDSGTGIRRLDTDLDIIDWRNGRVGRDLGDLARRLAAAIDRQDVVGILTHHLAHDTVAWGALQTMLDRLATHPAVRFTTAAELLRTGPSAAKGQSLGSSIP